LLGLALMFPAYFVLAGGLGLSPELPIQRQLVVIALITAAVFGGIPLAIATFGRIRASSGLALTKPPLGALLGAALLGLAIWPAAHEVYLLSKWLGLSVLGSRQIVAAEAMLERLQLVPLWLVLVTLAFSPAIFEELCFRGFLFGALRTRLADDRTAIVSAILFGLFHEILFPGRFLASTFLGLVLGWVRLRTASVIPCMMVHAVHNSLLLTAGYYREELIASGWDLEERVHLPAMWLALAAIGIVLAVALLVASTRRSAIVESSSKQ
jgi:membrane protease YdiL (CAAX protease family)